MTDRAVATNAGIAGPGPGAEKARLRALMLEKLRAVAPADRASRSALASRALVRAVETNVPEGGPVALFAPTATELSCEAAALELGCRHPVLFPRMDGPNLRFQSAPLASLVAGAQGIREPPLDAPEILPLAIVVPGRAFDRTGHRLGRGGGYYDRALASLPAPVLLIGFAYAFQVVDELPREAHDRPVQLIVTDEGGPLRCPS